MANNHIIIGLGGRGGDTLKAFRKLMYKNAMRYKDPESIVNGYPIQYIYLDSSSDDLQKGWSDDLGIDYGIEDWAKINTREGIKLDDIKNNISQYPAIGSWFGDRNTWSETVKISSEVGSGQLRKLGRAYFAASNLEGGKNSFSKKLGMAYNEVKTKSGKNGPNIYHVIVGMSGGTGSGTIVDVVAQINKFFQQADRKNDKVLIYAILPERNPRDGKDTIGLYHANAYAALTELNAIGLEDNDNKHYYKVLDLSADNFNGKNRIEAGFSSAFLFTEENDNGDVIDYADGLPAMVADFLYNIIVNLKESDDNDTGTAGDAWVKLTENVTITVETDYFSAEKERALKFTSAAIKRIEIPEIEIIDYYGAKIVEQLILQQKYNNWKQGFGYQDEKGEDKTTEFVEKIGKDNLLQICGVTLDQLSLKTPFADKDLSKADDEWDSVFQRLHANALQVYTGGKEKLPIQYLKNYMDNYYEKQFRGNGLGVQKYWADRTKDIEQEANKFYQKIESQLLDLWVEKGGKAIGLNEALVIVSRFINELQRISAQAKNRINHLTDPNKFDVRDADFTNAGCNREITRLVGEFGKFLNVRKTATFNTAAQFILKLYKNKTDVIAYEFAVNLIDRLIKKVDSLRSNLIKMQENIISADEKIKLIISEKRKVFESLDDKSYRKNSIEMLLPEGVVELDFQKLIDQKDILTNELREFRKKVFIASGQTSFADLFKYFNSDKLTSDYLFQINLRVSQMYDSLVENNVIKEEERMIGRNILDYFKHDTKYQSFENLERYLKKVIDNSSVFAKIVDPNSNTIEGHIENYGTEALIIQYPAYPKDEEYEKKFNTLIKRIAPNAVVDIVSSNESKNEILILRGRSPMGLRSFELVKGKLRQSYNNAFLNLKNEAVTNLTVHSEGGRDSYPKLIPFVDEEKRDAFIKLFNENYLTYLLIAYSIGFVENRNDQFYYKQDLNSDLSDRDVLSEKGDKFYQIENRIFVHDIVGIDGEPKKLKERLIFKITEASSSYLNSREMKKIESRNVLVEKINNEIIPMILKSDYENDVTDKEFTIIKKAAEKAVEKLKTIN
jgi:hypothetical protein